MTEGSMHGERITVAVLSVAVVRQRLLLLLLLLLLMMMMIATMR